MIGLVIVTHGLLGQELLKTAEFILGSLEACATVPIETSGSPEAMRQAIEKALASVDQGRGMIILTDMFGGTPSNISLSFLEAGRVEVLTGANLPLLIKAAQIRHQGNLEEVAKTIGEYGRKSITVAGEILGRPKNPGTGQ